MAGENADVLGIATLEELQITVPDARLNHDAWGIDVAIDELLMWPEAL